MTEKSEKAGLKLNILNTKIMTSGPITSWKIEGEKVETVTDFILFGSKITADSDCSHEIKRRLLRIPWTARRSNESVLKEISPEFSLKGLLMKLKLQYIGHLMGRVDSLENALMLGKDWRQKEKGATKDEMVGWHHQLNGHEFEQAPGDDEGQGSLACGSPWGRI